MIIWPSGWAWHTGRSAESGGPVGPSKALPTHHQKQLGVWDPGAFSVPQKLNFHLLGELVDRHNPKAQAGGLERRLIAYANWDHCNFAPHPGIAGEYFVLTRSQPDTRQLHGAGLVFI
jgi:hypothetical protein